MKFCKYCGTQISETETICPNCGKELGRMEVETAKKENIIARIIEKAKRRKKYLLGAAIAFVCIIVTVIVVNVNKCNVKGCNNKPVAGSKYCYSHKCTLSFCNNEKVGYSNYCALHYSQYDDDAETYDPVYSYELGISGVTISSNTAYTIAEGIITNNGDRTVSFVQIKGAFKTRSGTVVDTDWTYAVGAEGLAPGESCKWRMSISKNTVVVDCDVTILDFDY